MYIIKAIKYITTYGLVLERLTFMKNTIFTLDTIHKQIVAMLIATVLMWVIGAPLWMVSRANAAQTISVSEQLS